MLWPYLAVVASVVLLAAVIVKPWWRRGPKDVMAFSDWPEIHADSRKSGTFSKLPRRFALHCIVVSYVQPGVELASASVTLGESRPSERGWQ